MSFKDQPDHSGRPARHPAIKGRVLALCGGVGGAKLALGLMKNLLPEQLVVVVNTGDDFDHMNLRICPDLDTVMYTLAGQSNREQGWGLADESWRVMQRLTTLGGEDWFQLGDLDLATHIMRSHWLRQGIPLAEITRRLATGMGVTVPLLPMSDEAVSTVVHTANGEALPFQDYFVRQRCVPVVSRLEFAGVERARPQPEWLELLAADDLAGVVICPSNPYLSIDPMLAIPGVREALQRVRAPRVAVAPIVAGDAIKGPTAKIMTELGVPVTPLAVALHYGDMLDGFVLDQSDAEQQAAVAETGVAVTAEQTVMRTLEDRVALAGAVLDFCEALGHREVSGGCRD